MRSKDFGTSFFEKRKKQRKSIVSLQHCSVKAEKISYKVIFALQYFSRAAQGRIAFLLNVKKVRNE